MYNYPGQAQHNQGTYNYPGQQGHNQYGPPSGAPYQQQHQSYGPPPGAPPTSGSYGGHQSSYGPPPGAPPGQYGGQSYGAPSGPPPVNDYSRPSAGGYASNGGSYQNQQYGGSNSGNRFSPPTGPPPQAVPTTVQHYGPQYQSSGGGQQQPYFKYSLCNGKRKALLVGINYIGTSSALNGCINDVHNVKQFIIRQFGYKDEDIVVLTDDMTNPRQIPTRANIIQAMHWLVQGAQPNDSLFFHYSGHGGQTQDLDGDEDDGYDEVIYPVDHKQTSHIVDEMHDIMVRPLPAGCRLTAIFDSCHSGTALDLPYVYSTEGKIKEPNLLAEAGQGLLGMGTSYLKGDMSGMFSSVMSTVKKISNSGGANAERIKKTKTSPADCIQFSGCKDNQTSADTQEAGRATGAMSYAFIQALTQYPKQSYQQLLVTIRGILSAKYEQKPQLSASHPIDVNLEFIA
ncbi:peptidase c14 [Phaffia rhodozyma]|uniref:Peptidase c14 n=1 Tax=Phaffia rhodozyma TaxID=264483 RepID=A0A0F7SED0_PHARH|nr:peptidase c14 [Phaffia rhodozyma]